jgi:cobalt-zinc-cadmium efflux system outer membrane protein
MKSSWLLLPIVALAGCVGSATPLLRPDVSVPPTGQTTDIQLVAAPPPAASPEPAVEAALTLDQAINAALRNDPRLRAAFENINQAHGDFINASLLPNPNNNLSYTLLPLTHPFTVRKTGGPPQLDVGLNWGIDWFLFGKRLAAMAPASLNVQASEADYADAVRQRVAEVTQAFYTALETRDLVGVLRQQVENFERVEAALVKAVDAGGRPRVDLNRVRLDLFDSRRALRSAESDAAVARARLRALLGPGGPVPDIIGSLDAPLGGTVLSADESFVLAEQNRPDLQALRVKVSRAEADVVNQERKGYPEVTPQVGYTYQFQEKAVRAPNANSYGLGVVWSVPIFNRNQGERLKAASNVVQSQYELEAGRVEARAEIEAALQELLAARANAQTLTEDQLKLAADVRDTLQRAYQAGGRTLLEVLDANRNYSETLRASVTTRAAYWRALYRYYSAIGRQVTTHDAAPPARLPELPAPRD